jgi:hypothetical protein
MVRNKSLTPPLERYVICGRSLSLVLFLIWTLESFQIVPIAKGFILG